MGRANVDIKERAAAYKKDGIYINGNNLMCRYCNCQLDWKKKDNLTKHLQSNSHKKRASKPSTSHTRQSTIPNIVVKKQEKSAFIKNTVSMCLKANIPLAKLDHPAVRQYFSQYVQGSGILPCADHLRRTYVPIWGADMKKEILEEIKNKPLVIIADETSDKMGRCVFAVLFKIVLPASEQNVYLASCNFLDTANATTFSQTILDTLKEYEISYSDIVGFVSDSAPYMTTCYKSLNVLVGNKMLHFQCGGHKISLVGNTFMKELKLLNEYINKLKIACRCRKLL